MQREDPQQRVWSRISQRILCHWYGCSLFIRGAGIASCCVKSGVVCAAIQQLLARHSVLLHRRNFELLPACAALPYLCCLKRVPICQGAGVADTIRSGITNIDYFTPRPDILAYGARRLCQQQLYQSIRIRQTSCAFPGCCLCFAASHYAHSKYCHIMYTCAGACTPYIQFMQSAMLLVFHITTSSNSNATCYCPCLLAGMMCALGGTGTWMMAATYWEVCGCMWPVILEFKCIMTLP